jgi:multicomponent Na+:H+ antiporter subunit E
VIVSLLVRLGAVALLWLAATELAASALGYGLVAVPVVVATTYAIVPRRRAGVEAVAGPARGLPRRRAGIGAVAGPARGRGTGAASGRPGGGAVDEHHGEKPFARRARGILILVGLAGWVLWRSVVGGVDVARRAVRLPRADVDSRWSVYETRLRSRAARVALALVMNLMPGSLSARLDGSRLDVHVIDPALDVHGAIAELEGRLSRVEEAFG